MTYPPFRTYGKPPFQVALVHGGPGAPGEMMPVAERLSEIVGILEPLQKEDSLEGQIQELAQVIKEQCKVPVVLAGWSWGAFLTHLTQIEGECLNNKS